MAPGLFSSYSKMGCQGGNNLPKRKEKSQEQGQALLGAASISAPAGKGGLGEKRDTADKATNLWSRKRVCSAERGGFQGRAR